MSGGSLEDLSKLGFSLGTRSGGWKSGEKIFTLLEETRPVSQPEIGEGTTGPRWNVNGKIGDNDG